MTLPAQRSAGRAERWRPVREFEELYSEIDRLAQSVVASPTGGGAWVPSADVTETNNGYGRPGTRRS